MKNTIIALLRNPSVAIGFGIVLVMLVLALLAPVIAPFPAEQMHLRDKLLPPGSGEYLLGTDRFGRDIASRIVWGARISFRVGFLAATAAAVIGTLMGMLAGYFSKTVDNLIMRSLDVPLAFPYILLAIVIVATLGPGLSNAIIAIVVVAVPYFARVARGAVVSLKDLPYVQAARLAGAPELKILFAEIFPNMVAPVLVTYTIFIGWMILQAASLSFLGLGAQPPLPEWGAMLADGRQLISIAPHVAVVPGTAILLVVLGFNLLGDGLRDFLDPKLRGEHLG